MTTRQAIAELRLIWQAAGKDFYPARREAVSMAIKALLKEEANERSCTDGEIDEEPGH